MFSNNKKILEEKIAELEKLLSEEKAAHESDSKELKELQGRIELEERTFGEMRNALQEKLSEIEEKSRRYDIEDEERRKAFQEEMERKQKAFQKEMEEKRKAFQEETEAKQRQSQQEIERYQAEQTDRLQKRIQAFSNHYNLYLSKIYQASELLNDKALHIGHTFLEKDSDISELFQDEMKNFWGNLSTESGTQKDGDIPFTLREDAPAEKENQAE